MRDRSASVTSEQDHEFELVLGNKQLFSVLFIVFVLLGVFFAMGYTLGRNSPSVSAESSVSPSPTAETESGSSARRSAMAPATPATAGNNSEAAAERSAGRETAAPTRGESVSPAAGPGPLAVTEPRPGQTFLQVSAVARPEAEVLVEVLIKKGFQAIIAPGPDERIFRVLVGPVRDNAEVGKLRSELEQTGLKPIARRY